jgi:hypothetical protein
LLLQLLLLLLRGCVRGVDGLDGRGLDYKKVAESSFRLQDDYGVYGDRIVDGQTDTDLLQR